MVSHLAQNLHCFALEEAAWLHHYVMLTSDPCNILLFAKDLLQPLLLHWVSSRQKTFDYWEEKSVGCLRKGV
jgi:hypothetical protein